MKFTLRTASQALGWGVVLAGLLFLPDVFGDRALTRVEARIDGAERLISVGPMDMDGAMCPMPGQAIPEVVGTRVSVPVNPITTALALRQAQQRASGGEGNGARTTARLNRQALRSIY